MLIGFLVVSCTDRMLPLAAAGVVTHHELFISSAAMRFIFGLLLGVPLGICACST
jgi:hypothetical protein